MPLHCIEGQGNKFLFKYYPKNLDTYKELKELLGFGTIKTIDFLVDFNEFPPGICSEELENEPYIPETRSDADH